MKEQVDSQQCKINEARLNNDTKWTDLNADCQLLILEELDFPSLLNMAEVSDALAVMTADVFRRKFAMEAIELQPEYKLKTVYEERKPKSIEIMDLDEFFKALKYFGPHVTKLIINFSELPRDDGFRIIKNIINSTTDSLTQLHLKNCKENYLINVRSPFSGTKDVLFSGNFEKLASDVLDLNELFPNMRKLTLINNEVIDKTCIDRVFPHLEDFEVVFMNKMGILESDVIQMLQKNPQIRRFATERATMRFFRALNEHLPDLEELKFTNMFWDYDLQGDAVVFKNVKKLSVKGLSDETPDLHVFPSLVELQIDSFTDFSSQWADFVLKHLNLEKLYITSGVMRNTHLTKLIGKLTQLTDVSLICGQKIQATTIVDFVKPRDKLQELRLNVFPSPKFSKDMQKTITNGLKEHWNFRKFAYGFIIERK